MPWEPLSTSDGTPPRPQRLTHGLDRVLAGLGAPPGDTLTRIGQVWSELVGPDAAAVLTPVRVQDRVLVVRAADPAWASQVRWLEAPVVEGLGAVLGPGVVTAVSARVGRRADDG